MTCTSELIKMKKFLKAFDYLCQGIQKNPILKSFWGNGNVADLGKFDPTLVNLLYHNAYVMLNKIS